MTTAVEGPPPVTAPGERGWRWLILALVATVAVSTVRSWPASLAVPGVLVSWLVPVESFMLFVAAGTGACALAGWTRGGKAAPALLAATLLVWWVWVGPTTNGSVDSFSFGWILLVTACFGWMCMVPGMRSLLVRALSAIAVAGLLALMLLFWRLPAQGGSLARLDSGFELELSERRADGLERWRDRVSSPMWLSLASRAPSLARTAEETVGWIAATTPPTAVVPALLVLESLAALALAWGLWHRFARARLGPPLASLREFRFNDQLVWGLVAGATLVLLPSLSGWRTLGVNLLVVFSILYALRGLGVLLWWLPDRYAAIPLLLLLVCIPLLGPVQVLATVVILAFGLGLSDTWRDFRRSAQPLRPNPRP